MIKKPAKPPTLRKRLSGYFDAVGGVIYTHQLLNHTLEQTIWCLVNVEPSRTSAMLAQISSFEARIDLFSHLSRLRFRDKQTIARIKRLVKQLDDVNGKRNGIVHGRWLGVSPRTGAQLLREKPRSEMPADYRLLHYKPEQIHALAKRMFALNTQLRTYTRHIIKLNARETQRCASLNKRK